MDLKAAIYIQWHILLTAGFVSCNSYCYLNVIVLPLRFVSSLLLIYQGSIIYIIKENMNMR